MKSILTILAATIIVTGLFAQVPQRMSYQAVVRNADDALVKNGSIGMQISILHGSANGTAVYEERHFPTTNANGLATIEIGAGTIVSGAFSTINWANGTYFVKTETDLNGGSNYTITGTNQLLSVPYALSSDIANKALTSDVANKALTSDVANKALTSDVANNALTSDVANNAVLFGGKSSNFYTGRVIQASSPGCIRSCPKLTEGSTAPVTINSVTIIVPGPGKVFVSFNGFVETRRITNKTTKLYVVAQILNNPDHSPQGSGEGGVSVRVEVPYTNGNYNNHHINTSNTFKVAAPGTYTYYYRARYFDPTSLPCTFYSGNMSAIYTQD